MRKHFTIENALLAFLILLLLIPLSRARAQDEVLHESIVGSGGLICDNTVEVVDYISLREEGALHEAALEAVPGCGVLVVTMRMKVTALGSYKTADKHFRLVRYEFLDAPFPPQYGAEFIGPLGQDS